MSDDLSQYKDLYVQTAREYVQSLSNCLLTLEKTPDDADAIAEVFRSAHSLKGQSAAMGYETTGFLCHAVEDVFFEIKEGRMKVTPELADLLFTIFDALGGSIDSIDTEGQEANLSSQAEALKALTGVTTVGSGKSERADGADSAPKDSPTPAVTAEAADAGAAKHPEAAHVKDSARPLPAKNLNIKTIPVKVDQLDTMMNLLEELIVHRLTLKRLVKEINNPALAQYANEIEKIIEALQFQIMSIRAVPVKMVFDHFPRAVRDLAREEGKQIELEIEGEDLELDRTIVERLDEPLTHIIRNAASHGIDESGTIRLSAMREKDYAVVEIADNGRGIDWEAVARKAGVQTRDPHELKQWLFSGISTAEQVTQVSGRGVGLEVVKKTIEEFGGSIDVSSTLGRGTTFRIQLPLTLAVMKGLLVSVGSERFVISATAVDRSVKLAASQLKKTGNQEAFALESQEIPVVRLGSVFGIDHLKPSSDHVLVVIVVIGSGRVGLVVEQIQEAAEMIIKPVPKVLQGNPAFAGVTILGDGKTALIVNLPGLV